MKKPAAVKKGNNYIVNGSKCYIINGAYADLRIVFASTDSSKKNRGISCFAISSDIPGVTVGRIENKMGQRALSVSELFFDDVVCSRGKSHWKGRRWF